MAVFWVVAPYSLVEIYRRFKGTCCLHHHRPDDGGSKDLWNVDKFLPDYTALQPRRQPSSDSPPWKPQILKRLMCVHIIFNLSLTCHHTHFSLSFFPNSPYTCLKILFKQLVTIGKNFRKYYYSLNKIGTTTRVALMYLFRKCRLYFMDSILISNHHYLNNTMQK
jgi:hypothetical protein